MKTSGARRPVAAGISLLVGGLLTAGCTASGTVGSISGAGGKPAASNPSGGGGAAASSAPLPYTGDPALKTFYTQQISWSACQPSAALAGQDVDLTGYQCGTMKVPLDYAHPATASIGIAVVREPASDPAERVGSLLTNPGGPGASGVDFVEEAKQDFTTLNQRFDIVGFDPRGIGKSDPIQCLSDKQKDALDEQDQPTDPAARQAQQNTDSENFAAACEKNSGQLLPFLGTRNVARDMDVLRQVLGDKKLDYMGISYGTYLGSLYAEQFPQNTGHLVLDGAVDPNADALEQDVQQQVGFEKSLVAFATDCVTNHAAQCPLGSDPKTAATKAGAFLDGLLGHPLPTQDPDGRKLTSQLAWTGTIRFLYGDANTTWQYLRQGLTDAMQQGDGSLLLAGADDYNGRDQQGHYSTDDDGLVAIRCADFPQPAPTQAAAEKAFQELKQQAPILNTQTEIGDLLEPGCPDWPFQTTEKPHVITAAGSAPILVVGTTDDPATPYQSAVNLAAGFQHAELLTRVGEGHAAFGSGNACIDKAVDAYLVSGTMPPVGTRCTQ